MKRSAIVLFFVLVFVFVFAACGASRPAAPAASEPLVIPPMGSAAIAQPANLPPPPPPAPHRPSRDECDTIMRRLIDLTLDQSSITDPHQRDEIIKTFTSQNENIRKTCNRYEVDDDVMRCVADAKKVDDLHGCLKRRDDPSGAEDDEDEP